MKLKIIYRDEFKSETKIDLEKKLAKILRTVVRYFGMDEKNDLNLTFISAEDIRALNKEYRGKDKATDVLSWGYINRQLLPHELAGDIYICLEVASEQAIEKRHSLDYELCFLFIHGLLHVLGYDHEEDEEAAIMDSLQIKMLLKANIPRE